LFSPTDQNEIIEATFCPVSLENVKHPVDPSIKPLELIPVFPDRGPEEKTYTQLSYSEHPMDGNGGEEVLSDAILKPVKDPDAEDGTLLAYYYPLNESVEKLRKRRRDKDYEEEVRPLFVSHEHYSHKIR
jgi:RNA polymerase II-associated factor 1